MWEVGYAVWLQYHESSKGHATSYLSSVTVKSEF